MTRYNNNGAEENTDKFSELDGEQEGEVMQPVAEEAKNWVDFDFNLSLLLFYS